MITIKMFDYDNNSTLEFVKDPEDMRSNYEYVHDTLLDLNLPDWIFDYTLAGMVSHPNARYVILKCKGAQYSATVME